MDKQNIHIIEYHSAVKSNYGLIDVYQITFEIFK